MIADTLTSRFFTYLYHLLLPHDVPGKITTTDLSIIYLIFDPLFEKHGNNAYDEICCWEALIVAIMLHLHDETDVAKELLTWMSGKFKTENQITAAATAEWLQASRFTPAQLAEIYGLHRHWGHPTVDEQAGSMKVKQ